MNDRVGEVQSLRARAPRVKVQGDTASRTCSATRARNRDSLRPPRFVHEPAASHASLSSAGLAAHTRRASARIFTHATAACRGSHATALGTESAES